jgi:HNH endonuclease
MFNVTDDEVQDTIVAAHRVARAECHPFYWVTDQGLVYREKANGDHELVKATPNPDGYLRVAMGSAGDRYVHRVVLETFVGPCPPGLETRHLNGRPSDNRLVNLAWGSTAEQVADKIAHGTLRHRHPDATVDAIRALLSMGLTVRATAEKLKVSKSMVGHVKRNTRRRRPLDLDPERN